MSGTKHYLDTSHILKDVFDYDTGTIKTQIVQDQQFQINLDSTEDTITVVKPTDTLSANETKNCDQMRSAAVYVMTGTADVLVSPLDEGDVFISLNAAPIDSTAGAKLVRYDITAKRIRLVASGTSYLVLQG